jgi:hypothetical protein
MNRQMMALLIPILALSIPVLALFFNGMVKLTRARQEGARLADPETAARLEALEQDVAALRHELAETQERLDFTERLLVRSREEAEPHRGSPGRP